MEHESFWHPKEDSTLGSHCMAESYLYQQMETSLMRMMVRCHS